MGMKAGTTINKMEYYKAMQRYKDLKVQPICWENKSSNTCVQDSLQRNVLQHIQFCSNLPSTVSYTVEFGYESFTKTQHHVFSLLNPKRHSVDQCTGEQVKNRATRVTPAALRGSPRGLNLQTLHLKGAADTTVKILLQRKHQRGELHKISS